MKIQMFHILGLLALIALTPLSSKANPTPWTESEWPEIQFEDKGTYEELCKYDRWCSKLKDREGNFKFPHHLILKMFWLQKERLSLIAKKYGIHPLIPMAAIVVEHSLNVGIEDQIQDTLMSLGIDRNGSILGLRAVSYGYGQLYYEAAMNAEKIVARVENRPPQNNEYVKRRITSIEGAYEYATALMLHYTEVYASAGIDISHRPGILTTLYNLGDVDNRVLKTVDEGRRPKVNYFGWFVSHNWEAFEAVYDDDFSLEYVADLEQSLQESRNDGLLGNFVGSFLIRDQVPTLATTIEVPLRDNPPWCNLSEDEDYFTSNTMFEEKEYNYLRTVENSQLHPYKEQGYFDIYSKGFDCLGRIWGLLEFIGSGRMGWLNLETERSVIEMTNRRRQCEQTKVLPRCIDEIKGLLDSPDDFLGYDENKHVFYVRLGHNSLPEISEINWPITNETNWGRRRRQNCDNPSFLQKLQLDYEVYKDRLREAQDRLNEIDLGELEFVLESAENRDLVLAWITLYNNINNQSNDTDVIQDRTSWVEDRISRRIENINSKQIFNGEAPYAHVLTEADKRRITPIVNQVIERFATEIGVQKPTLEPRTIRIDSRSNYVSNYDYYGFRFYANARDYPNHYSNYWGYSKLNDLKSFYRYLFWAYEYLYHCFVEDTVCVLLVPIEKVGEIGKDLIENGLNSNFVMEQLKGRGTQIWFYPVNVKLEERSVPDIITLEEIMEVLRPKLLHISSFSEGFHTILMRVHDFYSSINPQFGQLKYYFQNGINSSWIDELNVISAYMDERPVDTSFSTECYIRLYDGEEEGYRIACEHFHRYSWDHKQLEMMILYIVKGIVNRLSNPIKKIMLRVEQGLHPQNPQKRSLKQQMLDQVDYLKRIIRRNEEQMKRIKDRLAGCNYNFRKTFDIAKRLSQSSCVEELFLPADKILNNKCREEGIHFNTIPFGEHTDRMAVKLRSTCE